VRQPWNRARGLRIRTREERSRIAKTISTALQNWILVPTLRDSADTLCPFVPCRFGSRGSGANQFEYPGGLTTTSEPHAALVVADTGNRRVCLFRVKSDHYGHGTFDLNFFFGHQMFEAPTGVEYDPNRGLLVVADQVIITPCCQSNVRWCDY